MYLLSRFVVLPCSAISAAVLSELCGKRVTKCERDFTSLEIAVTQPALMTSPLQVVLTRRVARSCARLVESA